MNDQNNSAENERPDNERSEDTRPGNDKRQRTGRFIRHMLRQVKPEHVPDVLDNLAKLNAFQKPIMVPTGRWLMAMPHGYGLIGEGPAGFAIEPCSKVHPESAGDELRFAAAVALAATPPLDEKDTATIIRLCKEAVRAEKSKQDPIVAQLYALDWDRCAPEAIRAVELMTYELLVCQK